MLERCIFVAKVGARLIDLEGLGMDHVCLTREAAHGECLLRTMYVSIDGTSQQPRVSLF